MGQTQKWYEHPEDIKSREIYREVWWELPPGEGQTEADVNWGWLLWHENGETRFIPERPTDEEIAARKSCPMPSEVKLAPMAEAMRQAYAPRNYKPS